MTSVAHKIEEKPRTEDIYIETNYTFDTFLLSTTVNRGLQEAGFYKPSPIQVKAIPLGKCGLDLIVKAKSGTGKTLVFAIIALEMVKVNKKNLQALIIAPTREIADQIVNVIKTVGKHIEGLIVDLFIGGLSYPEDVKRLKKDHCHIAVGAPGRIKHLVEAKHLDLSTVKLFVLDEADKLMTEDFQSDINYFYQMLPEQKQFLAVSATMTTELNKFLERYMHSPTLATPGIDDAVLLGIRQFVSIVEEKCTVVQQFKTKVDELVRLFSQIPFTQCLVFSNYQLRTESISNMLNQQGWKSMFIIGSQSQEARLRTIGKLKNLECKILLTTDLTARGIDASNVDLVINYDIPFDSATYLHRMGRSGRYGTLGVCITIASKGKELIEFQHILGDVGGQELSVGQLPADKITEDIWKCDLNVFEKICGIVDENRKKVVWEISDVNPTNKKKSKKSGNNKGVAKNFRNLTVEDHQTDSETNKEAIDTLVKTKEADIKNISAQYSDMSPESLLQSLAQGCLPQTSEPQASHSEILNLNTESLLQNLVQGRQPDDDVEIELMNPADLYPWVPIDEPVLTKSPGINLLDDSDCDDSSLCSEDHFPLIKREILNKKLTLTKNIALFNSCKILKSDDWDLDVIKEAIKPIDDYLSVIKEDDSNVSNRIKQFTQGVTPEELCNKISYYSEEFSKLPDVSQENRQNVCRVAYEHIIKGATDWRDLVGSDYKEKSKKLHYESNMEIVEHEEEEEEDYNAVEQYDGYVTEKDTYTNYYDYYDRVLAETAPTFEDVPTFHNWFEQWKAQVQVVTSFVQDKIYLNEMNNYDYYRSSYHQF